MLLPTGHKIGKPAPLFAKLEQSFIDELKGKYGGSQESKPAAPQQVNVAELEAAVQAQGEKLRQLKTTTKDKGVLQPEITKLLDLKKQLEAAQKATPAASATAHQGSSSVQDLEKAVQVQGEKLRQLKSTTKDKVVLQPEINLLLDLKKQLEAAQKTSPATTPTTTAAASASADPAKVKELEDKISAQGEKVRTLKATGDAAVWKPEVDILLNLKKELATLTGAPSVAPQGKNKKKK